MKTPKEKSNPMLAHERALMYLSKLGHTEDEPKLHYWNAQWWRWVGHKWTPYSEKEIDCFILAWLMEEQISSRSLDAQAIRDVIQSLTLLTESRSLPFWSPPVTGSVDGPWLNMRNWLVNPERLARGDISNGRRPKSSRWFSPVEVGYDYDPMARCPLWDQWCRDMLPNQAAIDLIEEYFGYLLVPDTLQHAALFLVGEAGSGKSTVGVIARALLGEENCSSLSIEQFASEYGLKETYGKYLNTVDETSTQISPREEKALKWYISGQPLMVNRKYQGYLSLRPTARIIVSTNMWPNFNDQTDGIWRRVHAIRMNKSLPADKRDPLIWAAMAAEAPGIFNRALVGLKRLRDNRRFTQVEDPLSLGLRESRQTVKGFIKDCLIEDEKGFVSNTQLEGWYRSWCQGNAFEFKKHLVELQDAVSATFPKSKRTQKWDGKTMKRGVLGIGLRVQGATNEKADDE